MRLLALLLLIAFSVDPVVYLVAWTIGQLSGIPVILGNLGFMAADLAVALASAGIWWVARDRSVSPSRLLTLGLIYQVVICFQVAFTTMWQWYLDKGHVLPITWVPMVIVLFPLILPGPPRRMLAAAIIAGAMSPLALFLLEQWGKVRAEPDDYVRAVLGPLLAIGFAYMGARVVYRLGREVAAARQLGSYRLEERLGQGGMGEVWRARHRMLARPAAIKLIRPSLGDNGRGQVPENVVRRFEREAQVIASLRSPHTVDLFDFGVADNGSFYYVMELLEGLDADTLVRKFGPVPAERAIYLLCQVCHSLSEAESCGLVHRDVKPANIFVCRYGEDRDFVKVLDFGLVKAFDEAVEAGPALTRENVVHGTPAFIAPEQAMGRAEVDGRVDIYATGCVAYWLLTGQLVFTAPNSMGLLLHHVHTTPSAPSARTELLIPAELDRLVLSCLAKDPDARPQSAKELSRRLAEIEVASSWTDERAREWWNRHQPGAARPSPVSAAPPEDR
ncbi:MAG TPA: serine/threonine-protein kinase [Gemmatimonadales bacterium]|nr:serine/threonine-protein kinase [Gemmatimonadales bacterium]